MTKILADMSVELWMGLRNAGMKASVKCSKDSASRYVKVPGTCCIRLSDHEARHSGESFDYEIIATKRDDPAKKLKEARALLQQLIGQPACAA